MPQDQLEADSLMSTLASIDKASFNDDEDRARAAQQARALFLRLESPYERFIRMGYHEPALEAALATCRNLDLFNEWSDDPTETKTVSELAANKDASEEVLRRLLKHIASMDGLVEVSEDCYRLTDYTASLKLPTRNGLVGHKALSAIRSIPDWLAQNKYQTPSDLSNCPFRLAIPHDNFWTWFEADAEAGERFNNTMKGIASEWKGAIDLYHVREKLIDGFEGGVLMVDLGGGVGHDLETFCSKYPVEGAEFILQDVQSVLNAASPKAPIKKMPHDFFADQPVKGPRSFFLKQIMHDWPDEQATEILSKLRPAMKAGYTKLLIHDIVVPPTGAPPYTTAVDIFMMALFAARERRQTDWEALVQAAGLKLEKIWSAPGYRESILEVVRE